MSIFDKYDEDYMKLLQDYNPLEPTEEEADIISHYKTPNRSYITASARGIAYNELTDINVLRYIVTKCYKCSLEEKYWASLVLVHMFYKRTSDDKFLQEAKDELVPCLNALEPVSKMKSLVHIDEATEGYDKNFFYLLEIGIGVNKLIKFGITDQAPRTRFAQIKADIKANYTRSAIEIEPVLIIHCEDSVKFEDEVKKLISEYDLKRTNYRFKGSSETLAISSKSLLVHDIVEPVLMKYKAEVIYSVLETGSRVVKEGSL